MTGLLFLSYNIVNAIKGIDSSLLITVNLTKKHKNIRLEPRMQAKNDARMSLSLGTFT